jgi:YidC/Oxa1 family membrane protein insertase
MNDLTDQQRVLIAFALMIVVLFVWGKFFKPPAPPPTPKNAPAASGSTVPGGNPSTSEIAAANPALTAPTTAIVAPPAGAVQANQEQTIVIESPLYRVELSNRGAIVRSWKLKKYLDDEKPPQPLELVNAPAAQQIGAWPLSFTLDDSNAELKANTSLYEISTKPEASNTLRAPAEITFHWSDGHLDFVKHLKFDESYIVAIDATASVDGHLLPAALGWRGGFGDIAVAQQSQGVGVFYNENGKLNVLQLKKLGTPDHQEIRIEQPGSFAYAGIEDQFFAAAFIPDNGSLNLWHWVQQHDFDDNGKPGQEPEAEMAAGSAIPQPLKMRMFVGPKDIHILATIKPPLDDLVQLGWWGIIAKPLLEVLQWTHRYIPDWGWAIVVLTLVINMALFPLKLTNWRSMKNMQRVGPEIRAIQDRYKKYSFNDPRKRKMNEEIMAIYNREGINPLGSCLPMLVQMPFLFAFYRMLSGTIELRHAPWGASWIHDLSAHDPYYILPILMTITMFVSQKMTPMPATDQTQQKMFTYMPLFFGFIFFRLSAGLNLYYFTTNLVGIAQQYYLLKSDPLTSKSPPNNKKK